jgi:hypothetical protein
MTTRSRIREYDYNKVSFKAVHGQTIMLRTRHPRVLLITRLERDVTLIEIAPFPFPGYLCPWEPCSFLITLWCEASKFPFSD